MKLIIRLYHFLGSLPFALILIATVTLLVILGTWVESFTGSHLHAAYFTYSHPVFFLLLCGFFINILFSALRRWPFKGHHIPFLMTHLGLLMVIGGVMVKSLYGVQGNLFLLEGSGSHQLLLPNSYGLQIEKKSSEPLKGFPVALYKLQRNWKGGWSITPSSEANPFPDLQIALTGYAPHGESQFETWIKGNHCCISGLPPFSLSSPAPCFARLHPPPAKPYALYAYRSPLVEELLRKSYLNSLKISIEDRFHHQKLYEGVFSQLLEGIETPQGLIRANLLLSFSENGLDNPLIHLQLNDQRINIPLSGAEGLLPNSFRYAIDLHQIPSILFVEDPSRSTIELFVISEHGEIHRERFQPQQLNPLVVYEKGFGGYATLFKIPFSSYPDGRDAREKANFHTLSQQLEEALKMSPQLNPPLQLLRKACEKSAQKFPKALIAFLLSWEQSGQWLYPASSLPPSLNSILAELDWETTPEGGDIRSQLLQQIFPNEKVNIPPELMHDPKVNAILLSAYLKSYEIDLKHLLLPPSSKEEMQERLKRYHQSKGVSVELLNAPFPSIEAKMTTVHRSLPSLNKWEENTPLISITLKEEDFLKERLSLLFDSTASGLRWPGLEGNYLFRFQPEKVSIPYHLRLRDARQINYPNSSQPYSFECDLSIRDLRTDEESFQTLSMNRVYETPDGYRFYLAGISPSEETAIQRVQIVVNRDPGKYWLTYPGSFCLSLGILLLFMYSPCFFFSKRVSKGDKN